jgi:hypothetical protein
MGLAYRPHIEYALLNRVETEANLDRWPKFLLCQQ